MELNPPVLVPFIDWNLLSRLGIAAILGAVIGIACGTGQWPLVAIATIITIVMMTVLRLVEPKDDHMRPADHPEEGRRDGAA